MKVAVEARRVATTQRMKEKEDSDKAHAMQLEEERKQHERDRKTRKETNQQKEIVNGKLKEGAKKEKEEGKERRSEATTDTRKMVSINSTSDDLTTKRRLRSRTKMRQQQSSITMLPTPTRVLMFPLQISMSS